MAERTKTELLREIKDEVFALADSARAKGSGPEPLPLVRKRTGAFPVLGEGSHNAAFVFIGEAPGRNEAATGRPFCGAAGKVLDELFASISMERKEVYVTNIVKDRPPQNRDPLPEEIKMYAPFLVRQLAIIKPAAIVTLGRFSLDYIFRLFGREDVLLPISKMHGRVFDATADYGPVKLVALYHPAVAVYNPNVKEDLKRDFAVLKELSGGGALRVRSVPAKPDMSPAKRASSLGGE